MICRIANLVHDFTYLSINTTLEALLEFLLISSVRKRCKEYVFLSMSRKEMLHKPCTFKAFSLDGP